MSYIKQSWVNDETGGTPINATRLNHIEDGIAGSVQATGGGVETVTSIVGAGANALCNLSLANVFHIFDPASTCTINISNATPAKSCGCTIYFHQSVGGNSLIAFSGTVFYMNDGILIPPAQVSLAVSAYQLVTDDGGATRYVWKVGDSA